MRDATTAMVKDAFDPKRKLSNAEWEALTAVGLKTDISSLKDYNFKQLLEIVESDDIIDERVRGLKQRLKDIYGTNGIAYANQAMGLGILMATGLGTTDIEKQQFNAYNIANLLFLNNNEREPTGDLVKAEALIDELASLTAMKFTSKNQRDNFAKTMRHEMSRGITNNGIETLLATHSAIKNLALQKNFNGNKISFGKGYVKENYDPDIEMQIAIDDPIMRKVMEKRGYKYIGPVELDSTHALIDKKATKKAIYVASGGNPRYRKSIFGFQGQRAKGSSLFNAIMEDTSIGGFTSDNEMRHAAFDAGIIVDTIDKTLSKKAKNVFKENISLEPVTGKLFPVMHPNTRRLSNYRYMMSEKNKVEILKKQDLAHETLGAMAGAIEEKVATKDINKAGLEALHEQWVNLEKDKSTQFVFISPGAANPKYREIWEMLPKDTKIRAEKIFGGQGIFVKKDLVEYIFGFREVALSENFRKYLGKKGIPISAHTRTALDLADKIYKEGVGLIKVRTSLLLPDVVITNLISNVLLLSADGIPPWYIIKKGSEGTIAIREYVKIRQEADNLKIQYAVNQDSKTLSRLNFLERKLETSPVHGMVEEGLLQQIVEDVNPDVFAGPMSRTALFKAAKGLTERGIARAGKAGQKARELQEESQAGRVATRAMQEALMLPGSQTFSTTITMNQMGDAVSRYIKYTYDINKRNKSNEDAINEALDYFVFYDEPSSQWVQTQSNLKPHL
jgi:hypothetical protein